jgi:hypothetical protein
MDAEAEEAAAEQRAILASFETWRRNETAQRFMVAERRAATARLADAHATARAYAHRLCSFGSLLLTFLSLSPNPSLFRVLYVLFLTVSSFILSIYYPLRTLV